MPTGEISQISTNSIPTPMILHYCEYQDSCVGTLHDWNISFRNVLRGLIAVVGCSTAATVMIGSTSKVGKIIGDAWGSYAVKDLAGVADLTVLLVVPVLQMLMLYVCSRYGLLQEEVLVVNGKTITGTVTINIGGSAAREVKVVHHHVN